MNPPAHSLSRAGLAFAVAAYGLWGVIPIYFKQVASVPPVDIVAHRVIWSLLLLAILLTAVRAWGAVRTALGQPRTLAMLVVSTVLIAINWLLYVYAINTGHILAGSLGYYLNPIANVLLGRFVLGEQLTRRQWIAAGVAGIGVAVLAAGALDTLWISLMLCVSFASYGLIRKMIAVESLAGLSIETAILAPLALGFLLLGGQSGQPMFAQPPAIIWLLVGTGLVSTVPLLCFTAAARRLPYSTLGMVQFLAPTLQFLLAVAVYDEPINLAQMIAFGCIWTALALYVSTLVGKARPKDELAET